MNYHGFYLSDRGQKRRTYYAGMRGGAPERKEIFADQVWADQITDRFF
ncbi:MAG: hypothetical protein IJJ74_08715 [Eubacterium sp.]|nr:hypothetical protein [Eubacterium sp.]